MYVPEARSLVYKLKNTCGDSVEPSLKAHLLCPQLRQKIGQCPAAYAALRIRTEDVVGTFALQDRSFPIRRCQRQSWIPAAVIIVDPVLRHIIISPAAFCDD